MTSKRQKKIRGSAEPEPGPRYELSVYRTELHESGQKLLYLTCSITHDGAEFVIKEMMNEHSKATLTTPDIAVVAAFVKIRLSHIVGFYKETASFCVESDAEFESAELVEYLQTDSESTERKLMDRLHVLMLRVA